MGNHTISMAERLFLRESLLKKYCKLVGYGYEDFERGLTGTLGHYEKISDVISDYIDDEAHFSGYIDRLNEGPLKMRLKKIAQGREEDKKRFLRDLKTYASANVLRKLLFYGAEDSSMSFKEDFITACYYYLQTDRTEFLRQEQAATPHKKNKPGASETISPLHNENAPAGGTLPAFGKKRGFSLKVLKDTDEVDEKRRPLSFPGDFASLNRDNLEPDNLTITSKVQAEIKLIDGQWYIENKSGLKTTYIQVLSPIKLNKGDVIIMGNTRFLFED
ncbi:MAG: hypothetical protein JST68_02380 [Bacteroidetes bacterium]|nr:hypothetical protein [Bacteroidota bacterium]